MDVLDPLEALLEMLLHGLRILGLPQNLQQIVVGHEVEAREHHPVTTWRGAQRTERNKT